LAERLDRLARLAAAGLAERRQRVEALDRLRLSVGYVQTLRRGYAVVRGDDGVVTTAAAARQASRLEIEFQDARLALTPPRRRGRDDAGDQVGEQGSLF